MNFRVVTKVSKTKAWLEILVRLHSAFFGAGVALFFYNHKDEAVIAILIAIILGFVSLKK